MFAASPFFDRTPPHRMTLALHDGRRVNPPTESLASSQTAAIDVRAVTASAEFRACVDLQSEVWGPQFTDRVPASMLQVATYVGGLVIGAFLGGDELVGMVFGLTGFDGDERVHWSHMLGVRDSARDRGIGRLLKEAQRDALAVRRVHRMSWTFDPLVAKNGHLNLNRLGAHVVGYVNDMYGTMASPLHLSVPTDRLIVSVDTRVSPPVHTAVDGEPLPQPLLTLVPRATDVLADVDAPPPSLWIEIPTDVRSLSERAPEAVAAWRQAVRKHFTWALGHGYEVRSMQRDTKTSRAYYLLCRGERA